MITALKIDIKKLTLERANQGLSQTELALKAGLSKNVIYNMENGFATPRIHTIGKIARALGKRVEDFVN